MPSPNDRALHAAVRWQLVATREVSTTLAAEVLALYEKSFGRWPPWSLVGATPLEHLAWKMRDPHTDLALFGGRLDGRLIHAATLRAADLRLRGERVGQVRFVDTSVDPDFRGRGLAGAAMQHIRDHHLLPRAVRIGEPQHRYIRGWYGDRNRPLGNRVVLHARIFDASRCLDAFAGGSRRPRVVSRAALVAAQAWGRLRSRSASGPSAEPILECPVFDDGVGRLFAAVAAGFDLLHERDTAYLNWRFCGPATGGFSVRAVRHHDTWLGYAVICVRDELAYLADLLVHPDRPDLADVLVADAVETTKQRGAAAISSWLPLRHPYRSALLRAGLLPVRDVGISYRAEDWPPEKLAFLDAPGVRVHYAIGDTDMV